MWVLKFLDKNNLQVLFRYTQKISFFTSVWKEVTNFTKNLHFSLKWPISFSIIKKLAKSPISKPSTFLPTDKLTAFKAYKSFLYGNFARNTFSIIQKML